MADCFMLQIESNEVLEDLFFLQPKDIIEIEQNFHCTILYGLKPGEYSVDSFIRVFENNMPSEIIVNAISCFENDDVVLKLDVVLTPELEKLNKLAKKFPYQNDYPIYIPHITLAYLKPGTAKQYLGDTKKIMLKKEIKFKTKSFHLSGDEIDIFFK